MVLNKTEIPGLPRIVVTRDCIGKLPNSKEVIEERKVFNVVVGGKQKENGLIADFLWTWNNTDLRTGITT